MADLLANLPPVPPSLKSIAPYLQRAEELRTQDPIIAYWCAYYAAQSGLNLKTRDAASRDLLLALLSALEQTKNQIGSNDAVHVESASSAYVENFALKVFVNADNEDRSAHATKLTAKKFLAAANFLEVLKTFPKSDISESNEEKIRYAKWKAADIAKAFREGRKPAPGPPGWVEEQEALKKLQQEIQEQEQQEIPSAPTLAPSDSDFPLASHSTVTTAPLSYETSRDGHFSPSSNIDFSHPPISSIQPPTDLVHPYPGWTEADDHLPQTWRTVATPDILELPNIILGKNLGFDGANLGWEEIPSSNILDNATESGGDEPEARSGSSSAVNLSRDEGPSKTTTWVSREVEGQYSPISSINAEPDNNLRLSASTDGPQPSPQRAQEYRPSPVSSSDPYVYTQQSPPAAYPISRAPPPPPVPVQEDPIELTPAIIAKAQKHCRFAVSALNYEDAEQAKKELRAALVLLGG